MRAGCDGVVEARDEATVPEQRARRQLAPTTTTGEVRLFIILTGYSLTEEAATWSILIE